MAKSFEIPLGNFQLGNIVYECKVLHEQPNISLRDLCNLLENFKCSEFYSLLVCFDENVLLTDHSFVQLKNIEFPVTSDEVVSLLIQIISNLSLNSFKMLSQKIPVFLLEFFFFNQDQSVQRPMNLINQCVFDPLQRDKTTSFQILRFENLPDLSQHSYPGYVSSSTVKAILQNWIAAINVSRSKCILSFNYESNTIMSDDQHFLLEEPDNLVSNIRHKAPTVICKIENYEFEALVDSGADATCIDQAFFENVKNLTKFKFPTLPSSALFIRGATGVKSRNITCQVYINFQFGDHIFPKSVCVVPKLNVNLILGIDFLKENRALLDCYRKCLILGEGDIKVPWVSTVPMNINSISMSEQPLNVYIFTDSHGHDLSDLLSLRLSNVNVQVKCKPGALFHVVIQDLSVLANELKPSDLIIIIGGTNNIEPAASKPHLKTALNLATLKQLNCKVLLFEIFPRYDGSNCDKLIKDLNLHMKEQLQGTHCTLIRSSSLFSRNDFTQHGLHLNINGKCKLADFIAEKISKSINKPTNNPHFNNPHINRIQISYDEPNEIIDNLDLDVKGLEVNIVSTTSSKLTDAQIVDHLSNLHATPEQTRIFHNLITENRNVFSEIPGKCNKYTAEFVTIPHEIYNRKSWPVCLSDRLRIRNAIQHWLDIGILEDSSSPYSSPIIPVFKKDGDTRLCLDARQLNKVIVADAESPVSIESLMARFPNPNFVSVLDFTSSFLQIELDEKSRDLTSFVFEGRNLRYTRVPFGTRVSMQHLLKAERKVFGPEVDDFTLQYVDELLVVSETFELHIMHLRIIFQKTYEANMTFRFKKCQFIPLEVHFVGFVWTRKGFSIDPDKIRAIQEFPTPTSVKHLQSFLGLVNAYRKFTKHHSTLITPLLHLLEKNSTWNWGETEQQAIQQIKQQFIHNVMLAYPDTKKPYYLNTDSSVCAVAGELFQYDDNNDRRPISYYSRTTSQSEKHYTSTELELLAIVACCVKFRQYILGFVVNVLTDHQALAFLKNSILSTGRLTRWALYLQQFDLQVQHIKGKDNVIADILSRYPPELHLLPQHNLEINVNAYKLIISPKEIKDFSDIQKLQLADTLIENVYLKVLNDVKFPGRKFYTLHKDVLFFKSAKDVTWRIYVPKTLENHFIETTHLELGHAGIFKTYQHAKRFAFFKDMYKKIKHLVSICLECQTCKVSNQQFRAPLMPILASNILDLVSVDLYGPLPTSKGNFSFIFVILDVFSKYVKLYPIRCAKGPVVTRVMLEKYLPEIGKPKVVLADRGPCFKSNHWENKLKENDIIPTHSSVYNPASNPVERYMRNLGNSFRIYCKNHHSTWIEYVEFFEKCMNHAVHESTGITPIEIMKGQNPQHFLSELIEYPLTVNINEFKPRLTIIAENLHKRAAKRKALHDKKFPSHNFTINDKVLVKSHHLSNAAYGEIKKFFALYEGPYVIQKSVNDNAFQLVSEGPKPQVIGVFNAAQMKPFKC